MSIFQELLTECQETVKEVGRQIKTFEAIFSDKKYSPTIKQLAKDILKILYQERKEYERARRLYRKLHYKHQGCERIPA